MLVCLSFHNKIQLTVNHNLFSHCSEDYKSQMKVWQARFLVGALFLACTWLPSHSVLPVAERERERILISSSSFFFMFIFFERKRESASRGEAEREGDRESQAGSTPPAWSRTLPPAHELWDHDLSRYPELITQPTEPPGGPSSSSYKDSTPIIGTLSSWPHLNLITSQSPAL